MTSDEAYAALGFAREGLLIPYRTLSGDLLDPLRPFVEVMEDWIASWPEDCREQILSTQEIFQALDSFADVARLKVSSGVKHLGHQLAKLAERPDWAGRLTRSSRRVGPRTVNKTIAGWRVQASQ